VKVLLVVFTDSVGAYHELGGWDDAWGKGSSVSGFGRAEGGTERGGGGGNDNDDNDFVRRVDHYVHHYGWPQLAMRRCVRTHKNQISPLFIDFNQSDSAARSQFNSIQFNSIQLISPQKVGDLFDGRRGCEGCGLCHAS
jgi:hypothetical protein